MLLGYLYKGRKRRALSLAVLLALGTLVYLLYWMSRQEGLPPGIQDFLQFHDMAGGRYLVWSRSCRIPDIDPRHPSIRHLLEPARDIVCSEQPPPSSTARLPGGGHVLRLEASARGRNCCYSAVTRYTAPLDERFLKKPDDYYNISSCKPLTGEVQLSAEEQFVLVQCDGKYVSGHAVVVPTEEVRQRMAASSDQRPSHQRPSVLLFGIDTMSRLNLARTMPRTSKLLRSTGWIELLGYTKVGRNTLPNLVPILSGLSMQQLKKICWKTKSATFDSCPFIWKDYKSQGYVTAYVEDEPKISIFHYKKPGFRIQPTDYYFRPFALAATKNLKLETRKRMDVCFGPVPTAEYLFHYTIDLAKTFQNALYFALIWLNNFSHQDFNAPAAMDIRVMQLFQELLDTNLLNNTLAVFLSDHGMRLGKLRETHVGWFEDRLPFIYIWLPEWFRKKYPDSYQSLTLNKNKLTSPYDLHATLRDILDRTESNNSDAFLKKVPMGCPLCKSLFSEIPDDRKCEDAGITPDWCVCSQYKPLLPTSSVLLVCAQQALLEIGAKLKTINDEGKRFCAELRLKQLVEGRSKINSFISTMITGYDDYIVVFETEPGNALFEALVRHFHKGNNSYSVIGTIKRLNSYENQSSCIHDNHLKLYCYCSNL